MIGLFDSGHGGLTVLRALVERFPSQQFLYLGDHANAPYGNRPSDEVVELTRRGVHWLFGEGARLVLLACNTATSVAARSLQRGWLVESGWRARGYNVIGIIAPTVEAATQTPWAVTTPQYPQKYLDETIAVFGTARTIATGVYTEEIRKRCPRVRVFEQACPRLASAIESGAAPDEIDALVGGYVAELHSSMANMRADRVILGCTHFPLIEDVFRRHLPPPTRILSQPGIVADSLEDYLERHPAYVGERGGGLRLATTGARDTVSSTLAVFWPQPPTFENVPKLRI